MYGTLNKEQKKFMDFASEALDYQVARMNALLNDTPLPEGPPSSNFLCLQARGGRGKTWVTTCIIAKALSLGLVVAVSSFAGVAAQLLPFGATCHRTYGLQLSVDEVHPSTLTSRSAQGKRLAHTSVHVIDEVDCLHKNLFQAASDVTVRCVNDIWNLGTTEPFAGAFCLLVGDCHQCLPITRGMSNDQAVLYSLVRSSELFAHFSVTVLTIAQRTKGHKSFDDWLNLVSRNEAPGPLKLEDNVPPPTLRRIYIPRECFSTTDLESALEYLFGPVPPPTGPFPDLNPRHALLSSLNETVDEVNNIVLDNYVGGELMELHASHELTDDSAGNDDAVAKVHATQDYMKGVVEAGVPPSLLRLKKGACVMLLRNLLISEGLVNGTKLKVLSDVPEDGNDFMNVIHVETVPPPGGVKKPTKHWIPRFTFELTTPGGLRFIRRAFPLKLAYSSTAHKGQGQTILKCIADVRKDAFSHGASYVMTSRCQKYESLGFLHNPLEDTETRPSFANYVIQKALDLKGVIGVANPRVDAEQVEVESGEEEEERERKKRAPRIVRDGPRPATFRAGGFSLQERRKANFEVVKHLYRT